MPTAGISLIRPHTEKIKPPRALWVPFELGRPLGAPNEPAFQLDVLRAMLKLFEHQSGPVIDDYPHDARVSDASEGPWACPVQLPPPESASSDADQAVANEIALLRTWYDESLRTTGRTTIGLSGLNADGMAVAAAYLAAVAAGDTPDAPSGATAEPPMLIRFLSDDLKAFYYQAASAQPGRASPSGDELGRWLFRETALGDLLYRLRDALAASEELKAYAGTIVPVLLAQRPER